MRNEREKADTTRPYNYSKTAASDAKTETAVFFEVYTVTLCHNIQTSLSFFNFGFRHILCINLGRHHTPSTFKTKHSYPKKGEPMWLALIKY